MEWRERSTLLPVLYTHAGCSLALVPLCVILPSVFVVLTVLEYLSEILWRSYASERDAKTLGFDLTAGIELYRNSRSKRSLFDPWFVKLTIKR